VAGLHPLSLKLKKSKEKNRLPPDAEVSAVEMVLREKFAGRAETAWLPHILCRGGSSTAEEFGVVWYFSRE
jgi:hypothetical protein